MPSFDIVSQINLAEVDNAINQANKELTQRFDFRGSNSKINRDNLVVTIDSSDDYKVKAAYDVLQSKLVKRNVSLKSVQPENIEPAAGGRARQKLNLIQGIEQDRAREIIKKIKASKIKVQSSIQGDELRISGKKRDDLQETIALVKEMDLPLSLQFINFRD